MLDTLFSTGIQKLHSKNVIISAGPFYLGPALKNARIYNGFIEQNVTCYHVQCEINDYRSIETNCETFRPCCLTVKRYLMTDRLYVYAMLKSVKRDEFILSSIRQSVISR